MSDYAQYYAHPLHPPATTGYDARIGGLLQALENTTPSQPRATQSNHSSSPESWFGTRRAGGSNPLSPTNYSGEIIWTFDGRGLSARGRFRFLGAGFQPTVGSRRRTAFDDSEPEVFCGARRYVAHKDLSALSGWRKAASVT